MTTITWKITDLERKLTAGNLTDVVTTAHWRCEGKHEGKDGAVTSAAHYGTVAFKEPNQDGEFTPFDKLTESTVIGWVKAELGEDRVTATEAAVSAEIDSILNPPVVTGLPWTA
jgi:hypothetical protein